MWSWIQWGFLNEEMGSTVCKFSNTMAAFLLGLTLKGPFQGSTQPIFVFVLFLGFFVISFFFIISVVSLSYLFCVRTPDHKLKGTLSEGESQQQLQSSAERINLLSYRTYMDVYGGRKWEREGDRRVVGRWGSPSGRRPGDLKALGSN